MPTHPLPGWYGGRYGIQPRVLRPHPVPDAVLPRMSTCGPIPTVPHMERSQGPSAPIPTSGLAAREEPAAALTDAGDIVERAAADQEAADEARLRFRQGGMRALPPDERIAPLLVPDECLVALRHAVLLDRREPSPGTRLNPAVAGELYVTSRRLVLVGRLTLSFELEAIDDAVLSGERLLLILRDGHGVALQVAQPRLLWVEIAAARGYASSAQASGASSGPQPATR